MTINQQLRTCKCEQMNKHENSIGMVKVFQVLNVFVSYTILLTGRCFCPQFQMHVLQINLHDIYLASLCYEYSLYSIWCTVEFFLEREKVN